MLRPFFHYKTTSVLTAFSTFLLLSQGNGESLSKENLTKMREYYINAETALQQNKPQEARDIYIELLRWLEQHPIEERTKIELSYNLANIYDKLGETTKEQEILNGLYQMKIPKDLLLRIGMLQVRLKEKQQQKREAVVFAKMMERAIPIHDWDTESRHHIARLKESVNLQYRALLKQAERLFDAGLYVDAVPLYTEVYEACKVGYYPEATYPSTSTADLLPKIQYRFAQTLFLAERYQEVIDLVETPIHLNPELLQVSTDKFREIEDNLKYLAGLSYKHLGDYESAIITFRSYQSLGDFLDLEHFDEVQWEIGLAQFMMGKYSCARPYFESLCNKHAKKSLQLMSKIYLARIEIAEKNYQDAETRLSLLETDLDPNHPFRQEIAFLRGEMAFLERDYVKAIDYYEAALAEKKPKRADWLSEARYHLGWSYLKLADDPLKGKSAQERFFANAEVCFEHLLEELKENSVFKERVRLALGQAYLRRGNRLKDPTANDQAEKLLSDKTQFFSEAAQIQSYLLRAEAASLYELRDHFYHLATAEKYENTELYGQAWYLKGVNDYLEAQKHDKEGQKETALQSYNRSLSSFTKAFDHLKETDKNRAALAIKYQAEVHHYIDNKESLMAAFSLLQILCQQHPHLLMALADPGEIFYLRGIVASKIEGILPPTLQSDEYRTNFKLIAEQSFLQVISNFPQSKHAPAAHHYLGTLYYQQGKMVEAQQIFSKVFSDFPKSKEAGDACFWASLCADSQGEDPSIIQSLRKKTFEEYSDSPHAAEAYFLYYTYDDYLKAGSAAIEHLHNMGAKFPHSPYLINAYYLIGLDYKRDRSSEEENLSRKKDWDKALEAFDLAIKSFDESVQQQWIPSKALPYFIAIRYHTLMERAATFLEISEESSGGKKQIYLEDAEAAYKAIAFELENPEEKYANILRSTPSYSEIYEGCLYSLSQVYAKEKNDTAAEHALTLLIEYYKKAGMKRGYYLSRSWFELGRLAMDKKEFEMALRFLEQAEESSAGLLISTDQLLALWIEQSNCYRALNNLDKAMSLLSKVINENAISNLRLKAMYLRAEIYEQQGRHELATKQLEATARKGGDWGIKAKEKLEQEYAIP